MTNIEDFSPLDVIDKKYFKDEKSYQRQIYLCSEIRIVMKFIIRFCENELGFSPVFTETVTTKEEDAKVSRKHDQHRRRVAVDLRASNIKENDRQALIEELIFHFSDWAYVTSSGVKRIAFCHDNGHGIHFHIAVNARYKLDEFREVMS